jgi:hypothetical protein
MPAAVKLRLLSLAAVRDGLDRFGAAKIGGMDRQTLRDASSPGSRGDAAGPTWSVEAPCGGTFTFMRTTDRI